MATSKRAPIVLQAQTRRAEAARLRRAGLTQAQIAERLGVSVPSVSRYLDAVLLELHKVATDDLNVWRSVHMAELDKVRGGVWDRLTVERDGKTYAALVGRLIAIQEREAHLLGLDAPVRVDTTVRPAMTDDEAAQVLARFGVVVPSIA